MKHCFTEKNDYVFKENEQGSYFFIIEQGRAEILSSYKIKKTLCRGEHFGELALMYRTQRSAGVYCPEKTFFWALDAKTFQDVLRTIKVSQFQENKKILQRAKFFDSFSTAQKYALAMDMVVQKFDMGSNIIVEGDKANSFYIIKSGKVVVITNGKPTVSLNAYDSFGEGSLNKHEVNSVRSATVRAETDVECLTIGRNTIFNIFGNEGLENIVLRNSLRRMIRTSLILKNLNLIQLEKCINKLQRKTFAKDETIIEARVKYDRVILIVDKFRLALSPPEETSQQQVFNDLGYYNQTAMKFPEAVVAATNDCRVMEIDFETLNKIMGTGDLDSAFEMNRQLDKMFLRYRKVPKGQDYSTVKFIRELGQGGQGFVVLVSDEDSKKSAMKIFAKDCVVSDQIMRAVKSEREILEVVDFPFICKLESSGFDEANLFMKIEYIEGSLFSDVLLTLGFPSLQDTRFYSANILLILDYLHRHCIIYRDLKPENLICDTDGYLKLIDFGTAKILNTNNKADNDSSSDHPERTFTIIGTPQYTAPEVLQLIGYSYSADYWSLGVILYEILVGFVPFGSEEEDPAKIYELIQTQDVEFPEEVTDENFISLVKHLLNRSPETRLNMKSETIMAHDFFAEIDWQQLIRKHIDAPFKPTVSEESEFCSSASFKEEITPIIGRVVREFKKRGGTRCTVKPSDLDCHF